ncbi:MAG: hypothetical protein GF388_03495 [Candidatus Aegiribacteria sp.]|nr:hypothetical protein [Candidatus Aegiribacteria sp.]MBD3294329.1 hypothetical protein [Candidatus Fermentibacteria bacterium]
MKYVSVAIAIIALCLIACGGSEAEEASQSGADDLQTADLQTQPMEQQPTAQPEEQVFASHILIPFQGCQQAPADAMEREEARQLLASVADSISSGEMTFAQAAEKYSSCPSSERGGFLGGFVPGQMVPEFDSVAFGLEPDSISGVFETSYGFHVVITHPSVNASHILIAYEGAERSTAQRTQEEALELIEAVNDSILSGELAFEEAAMRYSDCPSGQSGGDLGQFSRNMMTPNFEEAAFSLNPGDMSDIVATPFGYHIILRTE